MPRQADRSPRPVRGTKPGRRTRLPQTSGPILTARDFEILAWVGRHGVVTRDQVARRFFARTDGAVGSSAAYRRLHKLDQLGLVVHDRTFWREGSVLRLTGAGARTADSPVGAARLVLAEVHHALAVVDLAEGLLASSPKGTTLVTEREMRIERRRDLADRRRQPGRGRVPDALLVHSKGTKIAIELDLTPKRTRDMEDILAAYRQERFDKVLWYVMPRQTTRVTEIVRHGRASDFVEVRAWEPLEG